MESHGYGAVTIAAHAPRHDGQHRAKKRGLGALQWPLALGAVAGAVVWVTSRDRTAADASATAVRPVEQRRPTAPADGLAASAGFSAPAPRVVGKSGFSRAPDGAAGSYEEVTIYSESLLAFEDVSRFIAEQGCGEIDNQRNLTCLFDYVPREIVFRVWWDRIAGATGSVRHAGGGWIMSNLINYRDYPPDKFPGGVAMGLMLVFNLTGYVRSCTVNGVNSGKFPFLAYDNAKMIDPWTAILGANANRTGVGVPKLWSWKTGELTGLGDVIYDGHDISYGWRTPYQRYDGATPLPLDGFWGIANFSKTWTAGVDDALVVWANKTTGGAIDQTGRLDAPGMGLNHAQFIDEDRTLIFNVNQGTDPTMFCAYNVTANERIWSAGGLEGSFRLFDEYGFEYPRHDGFFDVSHNLEYFGEDEFMIFGNNITARRGAPLNQGHDTPDRGANRSAMVIMKMARDPSAQANASLSIVWWHEVPHANIYGDNDRLPSGNLLGVHWPTVINAAGEHTSYESRMLEVVRDTHEIAWEATVYGTYPCPSYPCDRTEVHGFDQPQGWAQYAVERFYDEPLVADASCAAGDAEASLELSFTAWNQFKQNNPYPGTFRVTSASGAESTGEFNFAAHWRPAKVTAALSVFSGGDVLTLVVGNIWGVVSEPVTVTCG